MIRLKKVLLVDDEKVIRKGIKKLLEDVITGYEVMWEASNGNEALEIANTEVPDLVITDIRMPEMNGIDFITYFKKRHPSISVIVISGHDDFIYVREALKLGVKDYLLKPISRSDLASILQNIDNESSVKEGLSDPGESANISKIKDVIKKNLEKEITLHFISNALNLHPNYISQLFKQQTTIKLSDYIMQQRIDKSKELLTQTNLKIYDISYLVGYTNSKHFSVVFKKAVGVTPYQYRHRN